MHLISIDLNKLSLYCFTVKIMIWRQCHVNDWMTAHQAVPRLSFSQPTLVSCVAMAFGLLSPVLSELSSPWWSLRVRGTPCRPWGELWCGTIQQRWRDDQLYILALKAIYIRRLMLIWSEFQASTLNSDGNKVRPKFVCSKINIFQQKLAQKKCLRWKARISNIFCQLILGQKLRDFQLLTYIRYME